MKRSVQKKNKRYCRAWASVVKMQMDKRDIYNLLLYRLQELEAVADRQRVTSQIEITKFLLSELFGEVPDEKKRKNYFNHIESL